jgi:hypothetical protein
MAILLLVLQGYVCSISLTSFGFKPQKLSDIDVHDQSSGTTAYLQQIPHSSLHRPRSLTIQIRRHSCNGGSSFTRATGS